MRASSDLPIFSIQALKRLTRAWWKGKGKAPSSNPLPTIIRLPLLQTDQPRQPANYCYKQTSLDSQPTTATNRPASTVSQRSGPTTDSTREAYLQVFALSLLAALCSWQPTEPHNRTSYQLPCLQTRPSKELQAAPCLTSTSLNPALPLQTMSQCASPDRAAHRVSVRLPGTHHRHCRLCLSEPTESPHPAPLPAV